MKTYKAAEEFVIGKHSIGWVFNFEQFKDTSFESRKLGTFQKFEKRMPDALIENQLSPGICELGDVLAFIENAPEECRDGWYNLFYLKSCVVRVFWYAGHGEWHVSAWQRDDGDWLAGARVFSPATRLETRKDGPLDSLPLELEINGVTYRRV